MPPPSDNRPVSVVLPTASARTALRPLSATNVTITDGFWADRIRLNREQTLPHGFAWLKRSGTLGNFRVAAGAPGRYEALGEQYGVIYPFLDSDAYKWLEAVGWELGREHDPALAASADEAIDAVRAAQRPDGYLNTYVQVIAPGTEYKNLAWGHELYCIGHLIQAAVAWHRALGRRPAARRRAARRRVDRARARPDGSRRHRRASRDRDGARRAVSNDRRSAAPRARRPDAGAARPGPHRRGAHGGRLLAGPPPGPRGAHGRRARRAPDVPRLRRGRRGNRARRRGAARRRAPALGRHGRVPDVPDRGHRQPPPRRGVRGPVRAAPGRRLQRDLRGDRQRDARLAAAPRDGRPALCRRDRADDVQRGPRRQLARWLPVRLRQPAPAPDQSGARRPRPRPADRMEAVRVLPAEPDAHDQHLAAVPRHDRRRRRPGPPVRGERDRRAPCRRRGTPRRRDRVPVERPRGDHGRRDARAAMDPFGAGTGLGRAGATARVPELATGRDHRARVRHDAADDAARPARRRDPRNGGVRARSVRLRGRERRPRRRPQSWRRSGSSPTDSRRPNPETTSRKASSGS